MLWNINETNCSLLLLTKPCKSLQLPQKSLDFSGLQMALTQIAPDSVFTANQYAHLSVFLFKKCCMPKFSTSSG